MKIITIKVQFSAVLAICMPYIVSIVMAIATTVIAEGTVDAGFWVLAMGYGHSVVDTVL